MSTLALRYHYDDRKLRDHALLQFKRSLRNDRLVALTGSMADEALGYFSWAELGKNFGEIAQKICDLCASWHSVSGLPLSHANEALLKSARDHAEALAKTLGRKDHPMDNRVAFAVVLSSFQKYRVPTPTLEQAARLTNSSDPGLEMLAPGQRARFSPEKMFRSEIGALFTARHHAESDGPKSSAIRPLIESLGIVRHVTLNYDLELERAYMLRDDERRGLVDVQTEAKRTIEWWIGEPGERQRIARDEIGRLSRMMGDGLLVESDVVDRTRPDRLFEFAVGSIEVDRHILHLHGRADKPGSMVFDIRDYDLLYRRDDLFRNPFEHGMRVLLAGNPILFVGLGMSEPEINEKLQYFVSNARSRQIAPAFVIWNTIAVPEEGLESWIATMRLDYLMRLGVHVIFDHDLTDSTTGKWLAADPEAEDATDDEPPKTLKQLREDYARAGEDEVAQQKALLEALQLTLKALPRTVGYLGKFTKQDQHDKWRSIRDRAGRGDDEPVRFWGTRQLQLVAQGGEGSDWFKPSKNDATRASAPIRTILLATSPAGRGRGFFAERVAQEPSQLNWLMDRRFNGSERKDRMLINAGFCYDSDSMLNAIKEFLRPRALANLSPDICREKAFAEGSLFVLQPPSLIILNGMDRFFGMNGTPLSAELDLLFRCIVAHGRNDPGNSNLQWIVLGTERVGDYFTALDVQNLALGSALPEDGFKVQGSGRRSVYLHSIEQAFKDRETKARAENKAAGRKSGAAGLTDAAAAKLDYANQIDAESTRRAFYAGYLSPIYFKKLGVACPVIFEVLRTMAFIGAPTEGFVFLRCPKVSAILSEQADGAATADADAGEKDAAPMRHSSEQVLAKTLRDMVELKLILEIQSSKREASKGDDDESTLSQRYALHRSLATELRERHGAPITEAKLSTSFNMSLFAAQPEDRYSPERRFHEELGELVDSLIGASKDIDTSIDIAVTQDAFERDEEAPYLVINLTPEKRYTAFKQLSHPRSAACLRAALAIVRGYYSTSNLLMLQRDQDDDTRAVGALTEHGDRLDRLLRNFGKISTARRIYRNCVRRTIEEAQPERADQALEARIAAEADLGDEPLYEDDFVWLHNERGVVKLVQGNLYAARRSFSLAEQANHRSVEPGYRGHNWRRISLNIVGLLIERGRLSRAERRLDEIDATIDQTPWAQLGKGAADEAARRVARIRETFGNSDDEIVSRNNASFAREEILMVGLTTAYRGLLAHMRGEFRGADIYYRCGLAILRRLNEARAYALFQRHYASLGGALMSHPERLREINLAVAAADATQQMDIAHRARVLRATTVRSDQSQSLAQQRFALQDLRDALEYATETDSYRVRIEAGAALAREMRLSGDYDTALRYAGDAMAVASRYGHSLHKIWLRVEIGQIFLRRGDHLSGNALLDSAARSASRTGYQRMIEHIKRARTQALGDGHSHLTRDTLGRHI